MSISFVFMLWKEKLRFVTNFKRSAYDQIFLGGALSVNEGGGVTVKEV